MSSPLAAIGLNELQLASGVGVLPVRTLSATPVPGGVAEVHARAPQSAPSPASRTRESKLPDPGYGLIRSQSTESSPPPGLKSLLSGRMLSANATVWVATGVPSTKNRTSPASHSIR